MLSALAQLKFVRPLRAFMKGAVLPDLYDYVKKTPPLAPFFSILPLYFLPCAFLQNS